MKTQKPITEGFHIILVGTTGSGKTHALKYLLNQTEEEVHILDPHAAPNDWPSNCEVHGAGRNFIEIKNILQQASRELGNRYQARAEGAKDFPRLTIALDELPSICAEVEEAKTVFSQIAREGRKVNIFLVMATQSDRVKTLNIAGEGDVRENFAKITMPKPTPNFKGNHKTALLELGDKKRRIVIPKNIPLTEKAQTQNTLKEAANYSIKTSSFPDEKSFVANEKWGRIGFLQQAMKEVDESSEGFLKKAFLKTCLGLEMALVPFHKKHIK